MPLHDHMKTSVVILWDYMLIFKFEHSNCQLICNSWYIFRICIGHGIGIHFYCQVHCFLFTLTFCFWHWHFLVIVIFINILLFWFLWIFKHHTFSAAVDVFHASSLDLQYMSFTSVFSLAILHSKRHCGNKHAKKTFSLHSGMSSQDRNTLNVFFNKHIIFDISPHLLAMAKNVWVGQSDRSFEDLVEAIGGAHTIRNHEWLEEISHQRLRMQNIPWRL